MKIGELARITGTSKKTIHYYIKEGLLRRPRKSEQNNYNYTESHLDTLMLIKDLRDHHYLPLPEIRKALKKFKKLPKSDVSQILMQNNYLRPLERIFQQEIVGREQLCEETGLSRKWLSKMEAWGVIKPKLESGQPVYSSHNVILGRLMVELDRLGFGPKDGYDPENLKHTADVIRDVLLRRQKTDLESAYSGKPPSGEQLISARQYEGVMSLFVYYLFLRIHREGFENYLSSIAIREK